MISLCKLSSLTLISTELPLTLRVLGGGWFSPHDFHWAVTGKIILMLYFFIVWFFNLLYPSHFGTSLVFVPSLGPKLWAIKVGSWWKNVILGKYKMGATDQIVYLPKKFRKQKSSVSLTYPWNGPTFLTLDQNLRSYSKKTDFQVIGLKKFPPPKFEILRLLLPSS